MASSELRTAPTYRELLEINRLITSSLDHVVVLSTVTTEAARLVNGHAAALLLRDDGELRVAAAHAIDPPAELRLPLGAEVMARIRELGAFAGLPRCVGVPLMLRGETIGVLAVYRRAPDAPSAGDEELLSALADQAAIALENARIYHQLEVKSAALRESERRFRALVDVGSEVLYRMSPDWSEMRELTSRGFLAATQSASTTWLERYILPEDRPLVKAAIDRAIQSHSVFELEHRVIRADGTTGWMWSRAVPLADEHGKIVEWFGAASDVTARKRAELEREELFRRLQTVLDEAPVGILLTHDNGRTWQANSRAQGLFGRPIDTAACFELMLDVDEKPLDPRRLPGECALRGEKLEAVELRLRRPDGQLVPILVYAAPIPRDGIDLPGAVVAFEDISSLKELERLRIEWSSVIAHDLRQPLNSIALSAEVAGAQAKDNPAVQRRIMQIKDAARRLGRMIQDLLDHSRLEARQLRLDRRVVELSPLVTDIVDRMSAEMADRPVDVRLEGTPVEVDADPDRFEQILENLLTNAVKYGTPGTPIVVDVVHHDDDIVTLSVTNHGRGIAPDQVPHLFQRFRTLDEMRSVHGIGLGLYITRELVEAHGGTIAVESTPGRTTTFHITLPVASRVPRAPAGEAHPPA